MPLKKGLKPVRPAQSPSGQTLVEFLIGSSILVLAVTGAGWVLRVEWDRARCARLVFQKTRTALNTQSPEQVSIPSDLATQINNQPGWIEGDKICGKAHEKVLLHKLEFSPH